MSGPDGFGDRVEVVLRPVLKEPFTVKRTVGLALIVTGVLGIVVGSGGAIGAKQTMGHLLFLGS